MNHVYGTGGRAAGARGGGHRRRDDRACGAPCAGCGRTRTPTAAGARTAAPTWTRPGSAAATRTASQTAWALLALHAAGGAGSEAVQRGVAWLVETQRADGTWDEPQFTGTGFPGDFYINYHLYRLVFPVTALGRYARGRLAT